jgi:hypothetical protein
MVENVLFKCKIDVNVRRLAESTLEDVLKYNSCGKLSLRFNCRQRAISDNDECRKEKVRSQ